MQRTHANSPWRVGQLRHAATQRCSRGSSGWSSPRDSRELSFVHGAPALPRRTLSSSTQEEFLQGVLAGLTVTKPPRTTWRGTSLHELWLEDLDGNLVEVYARLTDEELAERPEDLKPVGLA